MKDVDWAAMKDDETRAARREYYDNAFYVRRRRSLKTNKPR
jgi:hypothetical protein